MSRQQAREDSFKMLFEANVMGTGADELLEKFRETVGDGDIWEQKKESKRDTAYMETILRGVEQHEAELNAKIAPYLKKWTVERLAKVSLSILQLAAYEVLYVEDVPAGVSANEAVNLAKKYGGDDAPAFVNGVMRSFIKENVG